MSKWSTISKKKKKKNKKDWREQFCWCPCHHMIDTGRVFVSSPPPSSAILHTYNCKWRQSLSASAPFCNRLQLRLTNADFDHSCQFWKKSKKQQKTTKKKPTIFVFSIKSFSFYLAHTPTHLLLLLFLYFFFFFSGSATSLFIQAFFKTKLFGYVGHSIINFIFYYYYYYYLFNFEHFSLFFSSQTFISDPFSDTLFSHW